MGGKRAPRSYSWSVSKNEFVNENVAENFNNLKCERPSRRTERIRNGRIRFRSSFLATLRAHSLI